MTQHKRFVPANHKGTPPVRMDVLCELNSYGLRAVCDRETKLYALLDRDGKNYIGQGYSLTPKDVYAELGKMRKQKPLHIPREGNGLYFPELYPKCINVYQSIKSELIQMDYQAAIEKATQEFRRQYKDELSTYSAEWKRFNEAGSIRKKKNYKPVISIVREMMKRIIKAHWQQEAA